MNYQEYLKCKEPLLKKLENLIEKNKDKLIYKSLKKYQLIYFILNIAPIQFTDKEAMILFENLIKNPDNYLVYFGPIIH